MIILCPQCKQNKYVRNGLTPTARKDGCTQKFCSRECYSIARKTGISYTEVSCTYCTKIFKKKTALIKNQSKSGNVNHFCSISCNSRFNQANKNTGTTISKLEKWIQSKLLELYPNLDFIFNSKEAIKSELDIYIPSLKLAFELNGIFHYEPRFGEEKLNKIQNNDQRKFAACAESDISLCIIDTSSQKYFKESTSQQFLTIITQIIDSVL